MIFFGLPGATLRGMMVGAATEPAAMTTQLHQTTCTEMGMNELTNNDIPANLIRRARYGRLGSLNSPPDRLDVACVACL